MTNGDAIRNMTNEELARLLAKERMRPFHSLHDTFGTPVDFDDLEHILFCISFYWLTQEENSAETEK